MGPPPSSAQSPSYHFVSFSLFGDKTKAWSSVERACVSKEGAHQSYFLPMLFCKHLLLSIDEDDKKLGVLWQAFGSTCHRLFYAATHNTSLCQFPSFHGCGTPFPEVKNRKSSLKILLQISTSNASKYLGASSCPSIAIPTMAKQTCMCCTAINDYMIRQSEIKVRKHLKRSLKEGSVHNICQWLSFMLLKR